MIMNDLEIKILILSLYNNGSGHIQIHVCGYQYYNI